MRYLRNAIALFLVMTFSVGSAFAVSGCSAALRDRAMVFSEFGLRVAEMNWDQAYHKKLSECAELYEPATPSALKCFGPYFEADQRVDAALRTAVAILRTYWIARSAGQEVSWGETASRIAKIMRELPPEAAQYFKGAKLR